MSWLQLLILAIIQGLTEFLPVSSSAHLILPSAIMDWPDQGPLIDLMAHFGSLFAVMLYFRRDVAAMILGGLDLLRRKKTKNASLAWLLIIATPPALIMGLMISLGGYDVILRQPLVIALAFIIFGVILWWADKTGARNKDIEVMTWRGAAMIGAAQALALIPGTSRSGITMTAALKLGYTRSEAARFSMLMSVPIIGASGVYALYKLQSGGAGVASLSNGLIVAGLSFIAAYASIHVFMKLVERIGMFPFMIYRVVVGGLILAAIFGFGL
jgi:undecaprenyl-diphosphatase